MDEYLRVYGFVKNDKIYRIDLNSSQKYGLAYMLSNSANYWICINGTFGEIYGVLTGLWSYSDLILDDEHELYYVLYLLNDDNKPIEMINKFQFTTHPIDFKGNKQIEVEPNENLKPVNFRPTNIYPYCRF